MDERGAVMNDEREGPVKVGLRDPLRVTMLALLVGLGVEVLFHGHPPGISFPLWASIALTALFAAARLERVRPAGGAYALALLILILASLMAMRLEPMGVFLAVASSLSLFGLLVRSFRRGRIVDCGWLDFGLALIWVPLEAWIRPWLPLRAAGRQLFGERGTRSKAMALLRGVLLAVPFLVLFTALLASADLVFGDRVEAALRFLDLERLADWVGRGLVVVVSGTFALGAMAVALREREARRSAEHKPLIAPFLGAIEAAVVLAMVDLLFAAFVIVQFTYLFGGRANIHAAGYTYAEYARRGFGELVAVAVLSLALIYALAVVGRSEGRGGRKVFKGLATLLVLLMGTILASSLKRLLLYESAYGFTRLRTYTHVAIFWMAALFLAFLVLLHVGQMRRFALAVALVALGFTLNLNLMNVDAFIVHHNASRLADGGDLDVHYLATLSEDAVPALVELARRAPAPVQDELLPQLACWRRQLRERVARLSWQATHLSRERAMAELDSLEGVLQSYYPRRDRHGLWEVLVQGESRLCDRQDWRAGLD